MPRRLRSAVALTGAVALFPPHLAWAATRPSAGLNAGAIALIGLAVGLLALLVLGTAAAAVLFRQNRLIRSRLGELASRGRGGRMLYDLSTVDDAQLRALVGDCEAEIALRRRLRSEGDAGQRLREEEADRRARLETARREAAQRSAKGAQPPTWVKRI